MEKNYNGLRNGSIVYGVIAIAFIGCKIASLLPIAWGWVILMLLAPIVLLFGIIAIILYI